MRWFSGKEERRIGECAFLFLDILRLHYFLKFKMVSLMMLTHSINCSSVITKGGANLMMFP